jgi:hypothetical protein
MHTSRHIRSCSVVVAVILIEPVIGFSLVRYPSLHAYPRLGGGVKGLEREAHTSLAPKMTRCMEDWSWADGMARQALSGITKEFPHKVGISS